MKIVIVGGVAGGASAAARLRRLDESLEILLFEKGEYISFANCGLPYYIGGEISDKEDLTLQTPQEFQARFQVDVRTFSKVIAIDKEKKILTIKHQITGEEYGESYDKLLLSPGAKPIRPSFEGSQLDQVFTLRTIPDTYRLKDFIDTYHPQRAVVVGGGFIGLEMVENLAQQNIKVSLVELADQVLAPLDFDMANLVHRHLEEKGVALHLKTALQKITQFEAGLLVYLDNKQLLEADLVILAIGVKPDTEFASNAGLKTNVRGGFIVNKHMQTNDPAIYAVGDAVEVVDFVSQQPTMIPLAGPATKQGRIAANHMLGRADQFNGSQGSSILKVFDTTIASSGINEKTAKKYQIRYEKTFTSAPNHATYYPNATELMIKTLYNPDNGQILGAQVVGYAGVDKRADVLATAIRHHLTAYDLAQLELCYAPPYSSAKDPVNMVGFTIENILQKDTAVFHWHDLATLQQRKDITLLDVRDHQEYQTGQIAGFQHLPLNDIRGQLATLDPKKAIYLFCQVGVRGYIACRILKQHGFECYNLSGGYTLYQALFPTKSI